MASISKIFFSNWACEKLRESLGPEGSDFLDHVLSSITDLLPHIETDRWKAYKSEGETKVGWDGPQRRGLNLTLGLKVGDSYYHLKSYARRRRAEQGAGAIERTVDPKEFDLCQQILAKASAIVGTPVHKASGQSLRAIRGLFVEQVVGAHLQESLDLSFDLSRLFASFRELAEQSYENKSITYGL